jgi:hypothetical protein
LFLQEQRKDIIITLKAIKSAIPVMRQGSANGPERECVLFIGTRFSNLYTAVDTPAEAA